MIIHSIRRYTGLRTPSLRGERVVVVAVHRGDPDHGEILKDDSNMGALQPDDRFECVRIVRNRDGTERMTWVTGEATASALGRMRAGRRSRSRQQS